MGGIRKPVVIQWHANYEWSEGWVGLGSFKYYSCLKNPGVWWFAMLCVGEGGAAMRGSIISCIYYVLSMEYWKGLGS